MHACEWAFGSGGESCTAEAREGVSEIKQVEMIRMWTQALTVSLMSKGLEWFRRYNKQYLMSSI